MSIQFSASRGLFNICSRFVRNPTPDQRRSPVPAPCASARDGRIGRSERPSSTPISSCTVFKSTPAITGRLAKVLPERMPGERPIFACARVARFSSPLRVVIGTHQARICPLSIFPNGIQLFPFLCAMIVCQDATTRGATQARDHSGSALDGLRLRLRNCLSSQGGLQHTSQTHRSSGLEFGY